MEHYLLLLQNKNTRDNLNRIYTMEKEFIILKMEINIKVILLKENFIIKEPYFLKMETSLRETFQMV